MKIIIPFTFCFHFYTHLNAITKLDLLKVYMIS